MARSLDDVERERWTGAILSGDAAVDAVAGLPVVEVETVAPDETRHRPTGGPETMSLDGDWLLAGAEPHRQFSIEHWTAPRGSKPTGIPVDWWRESTDRSDWLRARVPGTVQSALVEAGVLADPLEGANTYDELVEHGEPSDYPWFFRRTRVERKEWWFARRFEVPDGWRGKRIRLAFDGIDYAATVYLNGEPISRHTGMYGGPDVDISQRVRFGVDNELVVRISPPPHDWHGVLKPSPGWGWHYGHLISMGIWRSVRLELVPDVELRDPFVRTASIGQDEAELRVQWDVVAHDGVAGARALDLVVRDPDGEVVARERATVTIATARSRFAAAVRVPSPRLWWPFGYGEQPLYRLELELDGVVLGCDFGIRTVETRALPGRRDEATYRWQFVVNGRPLFLKGANWCWTDPLARRDFTIDAHLLDLSVRAGLQMLRAWGGGTVESDEFFAECDRRGILVYQEFPLNFGLPDAGGADLASLDQQVARIVPRLRNHPSLVMWGGGNENPEPVSGDDLLLLVGRRVAQLDPSRPFHRTDPWGGSEHYYGVYHEGEPIDAYSRLDPVVFGEYGLSSQCDLSSMQRFLDPALLEQWPPSAHGAIVQHQAQFSLFDLVKQARYANYGPIRSWRDLVEYSQLAQGEALRFASERTRAGSGERTSAYWFYKLGEVFPGASWAVVDYYGVPKLSYFRALQFSRPRSAFAVADRLEWAPGDTWSARVHVANDTREPLAGARVTARLYDARFAPLAVRSTDVEVDADARTLAFEIDAVVPAEDLAPLILEVRLADRAGETVSSQWYAFNARPRTERLRELEAVALEELADRDDRELLAAYAEDRPAPLLDLPRTRLAARRDRDALVVENVGAHPAPIVIIDGFPHAPGRWLGDNAFGLAAGESRRIRFDARGADLQDCTVRAWNADRIEIGGP